MRINLLDHNGALVASKVVASIEEAKFFIAEFAQVLGYPPVPMIEGI